MPTSLDCANIFFIVNHFNLTERIKGKRNVLPAGSRIILNLYTTFSNGYLGSCNDEERSEMRYVMRIAEFRESSNLWTHIALLFEEHACLSVCKLFSWEFPCFLYILSVYKTRVFSWIVSLFFHYMESGLKCRAKTLFRNFTVKSAYSKKQPVVDYV